MAPIRKQGRTRMRAKATPKPVQSRSQDNRESHEVEPTDDHDVSAFSDFARNKKDKQRMRHSALLHRIAKTAPGTKVTKRRRPAKKLTADLDSLLGALPDVEEAGDDDVWEGLSDDNEDDAVKLPEELARIANVKRRKRNEATAAKMEMKTIRSRPGAMRKKAKMETAEKDRFARNMAQMAPAAQGSSAEVKPSDRWSSLRNFIGQTMQQSPLFKTGS